MNTGTEPLIVDLDYYRNYRKPNITIQTITCGGYIFMILLTLLIMFLFVFLSIVRR